MTCGNCDRDWSAKACMVTEGPASAVEAEQAGSVTTSICSRESGEMGC